MKRISILIMMAMGLSSCGWINEYRAKSRAIDEHKNRIQTVTRSLFELAIPGTTRGNDFASVIVNKTEFDVTDVKKTGDGQYTVTMQVKSISPEAMNAMVEIVHPLQGAAANSFNFTDGFQLLKEKKPSMKVQSSSQVQVHVTL